MSLFERIKELTQKQKISFHALEQVCGFGNGTIKRWDRQSPSIEKVQAVANELHVSLDYLVSGRKTTDGIELSGDEKILLRNYRQLNEADKSELILRMEEKLNHTFTAAKNQKPISSSLKIGVAPRSENNSHMDSNGNETA